MVEDEDLREAGQNGTGHLGHNVNRELAPVHGGSRELADEHRAEGARG